MKVSVKSAEFSAAFSREDQMAPAILPEIAILGRSNVGKSTFINRITGRKNLARASNTPGRTQALICFAMKVALSGKKELSFSLVDLPGFGFAKLPHTERDRLQRLILQYLERRDGLKVVCLLQDCRRNPGEEELAVRDMAAESGRHLLIIVNKVDKLKANEKQKRIREIAGCYGLEEHDVVVSGLNIPADIFWERLLPLLD